MEDTPTTKPAILQRIDVAATALDGAIDALSDDQMLAAPEEGDWSPRDVLAHLAADLRWFVEQLEANLDGRLPDEDAAFTQPLPSASGADLATQDGRNAIQYELNRHLSITEVRARWHIYRDRVVRAIERLPEASFDVPHTISPPSFLGPVRPVRQGEEGVPLWRWISGSTWNHFEAHLVDFQRANGR